MVQQDEKNALTGILRDVAGGSGPVAGVAGQTAQGPAMGPGAHGPLRSTRRDTLLCVVLALACLALYLLPTGFENRLPDNAVRCRATVLSVDNERVHSTALCAWARSM